MKKQFYFFWQLFLVLGVLTIPFPFRIIANFSSWGAWLSLPVTRLFSSVFFGHSVGSVKELSSDSLGLYIHVLSLAIMALAMGGLIWAIGKENILSRLRPWLNGLLANYLGLILLIYGFDKVFGEQFYFPEPNTLFTPLGQLTKDILFWSTMGTSHTYQLVTGLVEVLAGLMLLFRKSRFAGSLLAIAVMAHISLINFSFDISVKLFSSFLLLIAITLSAPNLKGLWQFLFQNKISVNHKAETTITSKKTALYYAIGKAVLLALILIEGLLPYLQAKQPKVVSTAFAVVCPAAPGSCSLGQYAERETPKRFFFHSKGYFIVQTEQDSFYDHRIEPIGNSLYRLDGKGSISIGNCEKDGVWTIEIESLPQWSGNWLVRPIPLQNLPLNRSDFHWTIESYKD